MAQKSKMWNSQEAASIANMLDSIGLFAKADLLDQYIHASKVGDLEKQAGLWERFRGWAKTKMFNEYKELVTNARAAQEQLDQRIGDMAAQHKELTKDLKNYRLNEWRGKVTQLNEQAKDVTKILSEFDKTYGNFLQAVIGIEKNNPDKQDETGKPKSVSEQVAQIFSGEAQSPVQQQVQEDVKSMTQGLSEWAPDDTRIFWVQKNHNTNEMRVNKSHAAQANMHLAKSQGDGGLIVAVNYVAKGTRPAWMVESFGHDAWENHRKDDQWYYFRKSESETANALKEKVQAPGAVEPATGPEAVEPATGPEAVEPATGPEAVPSTPEEGFQQPELQEVPSEEAQGEVGEAEPAIPEAAPITPKEVKKRRRGPKSGRSKKEWQVLTKGSMGTFWLRPKALLENPKYQGQMIAGSPDLYPVLKDFMDHPALSAHIDQGSAERKAQIIQLMLKEGRDNRISKAVNILLKE